MVTFLTAIKVSASPIHANHVAEFDYKFLADSTGQSGAAITDIIDAKVNRGVVSNGAGAGGTDAGLIDDGGSIATLVSETVVGTLFTHGSEVHGTVRVTDLEANEQVIVRIATSAFPASRAPAPQETFKDSWMPDVWYFR